MIRAEHTLFAEELAVLLVGRCLANAGSAAAYPVVLRSILASVPGTAIAAASAAGSAEVVRFPSTDILRAIDYSQRHAAWEMWRDGLEIVAAMDSPERVVLLLATIWAQHWILGPPPSEDQLRAEWRLGYPKVRALLAPIADPDERLLRLEILASAAAAQLGASSLKAKIDPDWVSSQFLNWADEEQRWWARSCGVFDAILTRARGIRTDWANHLDVRRAVDLSLRLQPPDE